MSQPPLAPGRDPAAPGAVPDLPRTPASGSDEVGPDLAVLLARAARSWWTWGVVAALLAIVLGTWAGGGLEEVPEEGLPQVPADARIALGPYDVAIQGWSISREYDADMLEIVDADAWVVVAADLTGAPPRSTTYKSDSVTVSSLETTAYPRIVDPVSGDYVGYLHPGVTTSVLILLPVAKADAATLDALTTLPALLTSYTYTRHVLSGEETWLRPQARATVQVPRDDTVVPAVEDDA
ncbi:hypothetical protein [Serinibacter arcticus]|uniref:hypothetical protein n=1 Tax=Serinibacter arcticus TaxID=1655435 RepID=UPI0010929411|nr:hypothetical protein [Serinibacter arcticus]